MSSSPETGKRGLPMIAWVGIGCGALVIVVGIVVVAIGFFAAHKIKQGVEAFDENPALASARTIVRLNPELEEVSFDEDSGQMTVRNTRTGEETVLDLDDIREGRFSVSSGDSRFELDASGGDEGSLRISASNGEKSTVFASGKDGEVPKWVPIFGDGEIEGWYSIEADDRRQGGFQMQVDASIADVVEHYKEQLEAGGFAVTTSIVTSSEGSGGTLKGINEPKGLEVNLIIGQESDQTSITTMFSEPL